MFSHSKSFGNVGHKLLHGLVLIALISSQLAQFIAFPTATAQAHNGNVVVVPHVPSAPPMNAGCTNALSDFGNAEAVTLASGIIVFIERTDADLYLCFTGIDHRDWFSGPQPEPGKDNAYLYLDIPHDAPATPGIHQYQLRVAATSSTTFDKYGLPGNTTTYSGADPGGWDAVAKDCTSCGEFTVTWQAEMRVSLATLGGSWNRTVGFMLATEDIKSSAQYPAKAVALNPGTWADLQLGNGPEPQPRLDSFNPSVGQPPHFASNTLGTLVHIHGYNLCAGNPVVQFGTAPAVQPASCSADGSELQVRVSQLAVTGLISVIQTTGALTHLTTAHSFTVQTFRNQNGFQFINPTGQPRDMSIDDYAEVFGIDQFFVGVDPCAPFGGHCRIPLPAPDPIAFAFFGITKAILEGKGSCFGMVLGSQRLIRGDVPFTRFGTSGPTVWAMDSSSGPRMPGLEHFIKLQHISQMSGEFLSSYMRQSGLQSISPVAQQQVRHILEDGLGATPHDFRLIALQNGGGGHLVLAYDLEAGTTTNGGIGNGDYFIYVYDPNQPYTVSEISDPAQHLMREVTNGRIHVTIDNRWTFVGNFANSPWSGGMAGLVVTPYSLVPQTHPTMPAITDLLGTLFFASGAMEVSQIHDAQGHVLLNEDGSINQDAETTIPDAARYAAMAEGDKVSAIDSIYLFGNSGVYTYEVEGLATGVYTQAVMAPDFVARVENVGTTAKVKDQIGFDSHTGGVQFQSGSSQKPLDLQLMARNDMSETKMIALTTTSFKGGSDSLSFDSKRQTLNYVHAGAATEAHFTLGWVAADSSPATFLIPTLHVQPGDMINLSVANWSDLSHTTVLVTTTHQDGSSEKQEVSAQPLILLTSNQISKAGEASFQATAYSFGDTPLAGVDASCSGAADAWQTVAPLAGTASQTVTAKFKLTGNKFGCSADNRSFYVRVRDAEGKYLAVVPLTVPTSDPGTGAQKIPIFIPFVVK